MLKQKIARFWGQSFPDKLNSIKGALYKLKGIFYYRRVFGSFGQGSILFKPVLLSNTQFIHIGKNVLIRAGVRLEAIMLDPANPPELRIGDNVNIEQDAHIVCVGKLTIEDNVSIAARCSLLCGSHPFFDVNDHTKLAERQGGSNAFIEIGEGSLIGVGSVILMNVRIGKRVVVGSSSVVKRNLPDYSVAAGNPAAVKLQYDFAKETWI